MEYSRYLIERELAKCEEDFSFLEKQGTGIPGADIGRNQLKKKIKDLRDGLERLTIEPEQVGQKKG